MQTLKLEQMAQEKEQMEKAMSERLGQPEVTESARACSYFLLSTGTQVEHSSVVPF